MAAAKYELPEALGVCKRTHRRDAKLLLDLARSWKTSEAIVTVIPFLH